MKQTDIKFSSDKLKRDITIGLEMRGLYSSGEFENESVRPILSLTYKDIESLPENGIIEKDIEDALIVQVKMTERLRNLLRLQEQISWQKRQEKIYNHQIRWYDLPSGKRVPSVTSIIRWGGPDEKQWVSDEQFEGLGARGTVGDLILQKFIETEEWLEPDRIPEARVHLMKMKQLKVEMTGDLPAFVEKYKVKFTKGHFKVFSTEHEYGGEPDCICTFDGGPATLADLKWYNPTEEQLVKVFVQIAAYWKASEIQCDQGAVIPIHGRTKQGFSQPMIREKEALEKYFQIFLSYRETFRERFGC
jgi:hypothetical protein